MAAGVATLRKTALATRPKQMTGERDEDESEL
jgi:hypothetical protein